MPIENKIASAIAKILPEFVKDSSKIGPPGEGGGHLPYVISTT